MEFDRRRSIKEMLLDKIIATAVETADAGRLMRAAGQQRRAASAATPRATIDAVPCCGPCWPATRRHVRRLWPEFLDWLAEQPLLYVPLGKGGDPAAARRVRACLQQIAARPAAAGCRGWACCARPANCWKPPGRWRSTNPVGPGAITEFDRLFSAGYEAIVEALVAVGAGLA